MYILFFILIAKHRNLPDGCHSRLVQTILKKTPRQNWGNRQDTINEDANKRDVQMIFKNH